MEHDDFSSDISSDDISNFEKSHERELKSEQHFIVKNTLKIGVTCKVLA